MRIVRTVRGDIAPSELGATDAQDHLFFTTPLQPGDEFGDLRCAINEARTLVDAGGKALVDWTPIGLGRNPDGLRSVAEATGLHIVAATGVHRDAHYPGHHPLRSEMVAALADRFVADVTGDGVRSGVIKIGASYHSPQPFEQKTFEARRRRTHGPACPSASTASTGRMAWGAEKRSRVAREPRMIRR